MDRLLTIAGKDIKLIARDRGALLVMLAMPFALIFILGSALGGIGQGDSLDVDVAIVNHDAGGTGKHFVDGLTSSPEVDELFNITVRDDADQVRTDVEKGDLTAALIIPEDLTSRIMAGEPAALEVLQDPGSEMAAGIWAGVVRAGVAQASAEIIAARTLPAISGAAQGPPEAGIPLDAVTVRDAEAEVEEAISMISYYSAGMTAMFLLFGSMFGAFSFVKERREQTLARMMCAPAGKPAIVGGKAAGVSLVAVGQFLILLLGTSLVFGVDWGDNLVGTLLIGLAEAFAAAGLAMTLAALGKTERAIGGIGPAAIMFFSATGGSMIPSEQLPAWLLPVQVVSPIYWSLNGFIDLMRGASLAEVLPGIGAVLALGVLFLAFGIWRLRYE
jgi:ABC-2 type transport system permease protein